MTTVSLESFNEKYIQKTGDKMIWKERYNENGLVGFSYSKPSCRQIKSLNKLDLKSVLWVPHDFYFRGEIKIDSFHPETLNILEENNIFDLDCFNTHKDYLGYLFFKTEDNKLASFIISKLGVIKEYVPAHMTSSDYMNLAELFCHMVLTYNNKKYTICPPEIVLRNVFFYEFEEIDGNIHESILTYELLQDSEYPPKSVRNLVTESILNPESESHFFINQYPMLINPETFALLPRKAMDYRGHTIPASDQYLIIELNNYYYDSSTVKSVFVNGFCFEGIMFEKFYKKILVNNTIPECSSLLVRIIDNILDNYKSVYENTLTPHLLEDNQTPFPWREYHIQDNHMFFLLSLMILNEIYQKLNLSGFLLELDLQKYPSYLPLTIFSKEPKSHREIYQLIQNYINEVNDILEGDESPNIINKEINVDNNLNTISILHSPLTGDDESLDGWKFLNNSLPLKLIDKTINPQDIYNKLIEEFPYLKEPSLYVVQRLALCQKYNRPFSFAPILLDGAPGIGKTRWAKRVAEYCNTSYSFHSLSGVSSSMGIIGSERGWKSARPGFWAFTVRDTMIANPVVVMDELDKLGTGTQNGSAQTALLPFLEKETSKRYKDIFFMIDVNVSYFSYVFTSNEILDISDPLKSRLKLFKCRKPTQKEINEIFSNILNDIIHDLDINIDDIAHMDFSSIRNGYSQHESIRILKTEIENKIMNSIFSVSDTDSNGNSFEKKSMGFMIR